MKAYDTSILFHAKKLKKKNEKSKIWPKTVFAAAKFSKKIHKMFNISLGIPDGF